LLEVALTHYQDFLDSRADDPGSRAELAMEESRVRRILGSLKEDLKALQAAHLWGHLSDPQVQRELRLSRAQCDRIRQLSDGWRRQMFRPGKTAEERRAALLATAREQEQTLGTTLQPWQQKRLRQMTIQFQGPMAFRDPEVIEALKLTQEQREQLC